MKPFIKKFTLIAMFILSAQAFAQIKLGHNPAPAMRGHRGGNGGNSTAADVVTIAQNILTVWKDICKRSPNDQCRYIRDFEQLLDKRSSLYTTVLMETTTHAFDGHQRDATNDGSKTIIVNKTNWDDMMESGSYNSQVGVLKLVTHEYFSILGLDSSDYYQESNKLIGRVLRKGFLPQVLTRTEGLPSRCSLNFTEQKESLTKSSQKIIRNKNYELNSNTEESRYSIRIKRACFDQTIGNLCSSYIEQIDNFTGKVIFNNILAKKYTLTSSHKALKKVFNLSLEKMNSCD